MEVLKQLSEDLKFISDGVDNINEADLEFCLEIRERIFRAKKETILGVGNAHTSFTPSMGVSSFDKEIASVYLQVRTRIMDILLQEPQSELEIRRPEILKKCLDVTREYRDHPTENRKKIKTKLASICKGDEYKEESSSLDRYQYSTRERAVFALKGLYSHYE